MNELAVRNQVKHYLLTGECGNMDVLKEKIVEFAHDGNFMTLMDIDEIIRENGRKNSPGYDGEILRRTLDFLNVLTDEYKFSLTNIEIEYEEKIDKLKRYTKEIEKASRTMGRQNLALSYFCQAGQMISSSLDSRRIIPIIVEMVRNIFDDSFCCLLGVDSDEKVRVTPHNHPESAKFAAYFNEKIDMRLGEGCEGYCMLEQIPCQVFDVYGNPLYSNFRELADIFNFQSVLSVPLKIKGQVGGCISIYSSERRFFPDDEVQILTMFANQASQAIENAFEYQKTDTQLQVRLMELSLMHTLDQAIINNEKIDKISSILVEGMEKVFPDCGFALDLSRLESGLAVSNNEFRRTSYFENISNFTGDIISKNDLVHKECFSGEDLLTVIGFPITLRNETVGSFWVSIKNKGQDNSDIIEYVRWILAQISIALEKSKTLENLIHVEKMNVLGTMLSGIAHELNNPLSRILGLTEMSDEESDIEEIRKSLELIREEALRSKSIMEDFLAFARKYKAVETVTDVNQVVSNTLNLWKYQKKTEDMKILTKFQNNLPTVRININRIQQIFLNLIINAYAALSGAQKENKTLKIETLLYDNKIRVIFNDNGPGIESDKLEKIFEPFYTTKEKGHGTGLGLSLSRDIVREHNGRIWAESAPGKGARFILELPIYTDKTIPIKKTKMLSVSTLSGFNILLADDDPLILKLMSAFLRRSGNAVKTVSNGKACLEKMKQEKFDVVVSDMIMPDIRGDKLIQILDGENPDALKRLILCTGDILDKDQVGSLESKGIHILYKPFELAELKNAIEKIIYS